MKYLWPEMLLWRGSLLPLGRDAPLKQVAAFLPNILCNLLYDCFAAEREQAPSPQ